MKCEQAIAWICAEIDHPLEPEDRACLHIHLRECEGCRATAEAFRLQDQDLHEAFEPRREAVEVTTERVLSQLAQQPIQEGPPSTARAEAKLYRLRWRLGWTLAVAAVLALAALGLRALNQTSVWMPADGRPMAGAGTSGPLFLVPAAVGPPELRTTLPIPSGDKPEGNAARIQVQTGLAERRRVTLDDGSVLYVNRNTTVNQKARRHLALLAGEVFVDAASPEAGTSDAPFVIEAPDRQVTAVGTRFAVRAEDEGTRVMVTHGKVRVSGLEQPVLAGQQLAPGAMEPAPAPRATHVLDWTRELVVAAESPLVPPSKHCGGALLTIDPSGQEARLSLRKYHVDVHIEDGFARTTIDQTYFNHHTANMEGTFCFPLPPDASLNRLAMYVEGNLMEGGMAERNHARAVYEQIVYTRRDPALLEWVDGSTFKMRVFPLEARQEKRIVLSYIQKLETLYGHTRYRFPSGHNLEMVRDWSFHARIKDGSRLTWTSHSHALQGRKEKDDLLLDTADQNVKIDRDVCLDLRGLEAAAGGGETSCFASAEHEGKRYLMVRHRPHLPGEARRQRRDWVFIHESSADRDHVLARAQREVLHNLLAHAEADDTFAVLSAGTHVRAFAPEPRPVTPAHVKEAVKFLEGIHRIGALDLGRALTAAQPLLKAGRNPYLVHLGSATPVLGERSTDALLRRLPEGTRYVGVGVGKRWARSFMKAAADRTGGWFTQINPDESLAWRTFDLHATLNTPRLLDVKVVDDAERLRFLSFGSSVAQGEELCAVARLDVPGQPMPREVTLSGTHDGSPWHRVLPVRNVATKADYLPRTWAKLEIDRLLAENAEANKTRIIELSKAAYVMTPFTSLLVLENDAMYEQFKVDRGRKDHWAMYRCPDKIPVVHEPLHSVVRVQGVSPAGKPGQPPTREKVLQTILAGTTPLAISGPDPDASTYTPAQFHYSRIQYAPVFVSPVMTWAVPNTGIQQPGGDRRTLLNHFDMPWSERGTGMPPVLTGGPLPPVASTTSVSGSGLFVPVPPGIPMLPNMPVAPGGGGLPAAPGFGFMPGFGDYFVPYSAARQASVNGYTYGPYTLMGRNALDPTSPIGSGNGRVLVTSWEDTYRRLLPGQANQLPVMEELLKDLDARTLPSLTSRELLRGNLDSAVARRLAVTGESPFRFFTLLPTEQKARISETDELKKLIDLLDDGTLAQVVTGSAPGSLLYQRTTLASPDARLAWDLTLQAPGLATTTADILATLDAEAPSATTPAPGQIDPQAERILARARVSTWQAVSWRDDGPLPATTIRFDGTGRYFWEQVLPSGLREQVACDGTTLRHRYPELGLAASRKVSRYHRAQIQQMLPWIVPPVEDLARGADIQALDERTIAIIPHDGRTEENRVQAQVHLVFARDGRLAEHRLVEMPGRKVRYRLVCGREGTIQLLDGAGKTVWQRQATLTPCDTPELAPDSSKLVIVPIPVRTADHVCREHGVRPEQPGNLEKLPRAALTALLTAYLASGQPSPAVQAFVQGCRDPRNRLLGFYVLLAAAGIDVQSNQNGVRVLDAHPGEPLAQYLSIVSSPNRRSDPELLMGIGSKAKGFAARMARLQELSCRWQMGKFAANRSGDVQATVRFLGEMPPSLLGWSLLNTLQDHTAGNSEALLAFAAACESYERHPVLGYSARYERARALLQAGQTLRARELFQGLYAQTLQSGMLPPIDHSFLQAFGTDGAPGDPWAAFMRRMAEQAGRRSRTNVLRLAWQVQQLGRQPFADELVSLAVTDLPSNERAVTTLGAVEYLRQTGQHARALAQLEPLLKDAEHLQNPALWRLAYTLASQKGTGGKVIAYLEKALELEHRQPALVVNLQTVRSEYGTLMNQYQSLAAAIASLQVEPPRDFVARVVGAADRWRTIDPEPGSACQSASQVLKALGAEELAWEYLTTPMALKPNEASLWLGMAQTLRAQGDAVLADRAYAAAFEAEPTNAQILWDRAQHLRQIGRTEEARRLFRQLAQSEWQPRFQSLRDQARSLVPAR